MPVLYKPFQSVLEDKNKKKLFNFLLDIYIK